MTPERMAEIRAREQAASKGPWQYEFAFGVGGQDLGSLTLGGYKPDRLIQEEDGIFIAHARQDVPDLLDEVEGLEKELSQANHWHALYANKVNELRERYNAGGAVSRDEACQRVVGEVWDEAYRHGFKTAKALSDTPEEA